MWESMTGKLSKTCFCSDQKLETHAYTFYAIRLEQVKASGMLEEEESMKRGDKVQVKDLATVEASYRGKIGTVTADSRLGDVVVAEFGDKTSSHAFNASELNPVARKAHTSKLQKERGRKSR
jgi:hypothetical protein